MKRTLARIYQWEYFWLSVIVIVTLAMHLSIVPLPKDPILDEAHYAGFFGETHEPVSGDAYSIIHNHMDMRPEHPPLAKLFIVGGIYAFGDNQWGWRVPSVIMGTIGIILFFFICRRLKLSRRATNIATFLLGFENFTFVQASVAMLDVFYVTLMLAFFLLYLHRQYLLSGVFIGLSALAKLTGVLGAPALFVHYLFTRTRRSAWFAMTLIMAAVSLVAFLPLFDFAITHQLHNPISRIKEMLSLSGSLTFFNVTHPALSRPWSWLLNYNPMAYWYTPHYTGAVSPTVWLLMIPVVLYMIYRAAKGDDAGLFGFAWFFGTYLLWIPMSIATNRVSFPFYFPPTIGALCLGLGMGLTNAQYWVSKRTRGKRVTINVAIIAFLVIHVAFFVFLTPVFFRK